MPGGGSFLVKHHVNIHRLDGLGVDKPLPMEVGVVGFKPAIGGEGRVGDKGLVVARAG